MQSQDRTEVVQPGSQPALSHADDDVASRFDFDVTEIFGHDNIIEPEVRQIWPRIPCSAYSYF